MDLVIRTPRVPQPGETLLGHDFQTFPGGKGANQAVAAARLGADVTLVGCIGPDTFGERLRAGLESEGVQTRHVGVERDTATGIAAITVDDSGQNSIIVVSGANMHLTPEWITAAWQSVDKPDAVVMQLEIPLACITRVADLARAAGVRVVLNPAPAQPLSEELLRQIDLLVPNETETALLTGLPVDTMQHVERAARALLDGGVGETVITLGERGALLLSGDGAAQHLPAQTVEVIDTTAAGDAFVAALAVALTDGASMEDAVRWAIAAGSLAVTRLGAQPSMPTREEVEQFIKNG
jgi:ribokinase